MDTIQNPGGMWPVMLTPYTNDGRVDYPSLERLIHWYEENGADGLFAVCQSSEMFFLSLRERVRIAEFVKSHASIPVIASGHTSYDLEDQKAELQAVAAAGVDAVVLITNRMDCHCHGRNAAEWLENLQRLMDALDPELPLGLYECPAPYKHLLSDEEIRFAADSGRFLFLKDTCCDMDVIRRRLDIIKGSPLRLFNANSSTLLDSMRAGAAGFSGIMVNFHAALYAKLLACWKDQPELAERIQAHLSLCSRMEGQCYPVNAKYSLKKLGVLSTINCRSNDPARFSPLMAQEVDYMTRITDDLLASLG